MARQAETGDIGCSMDLIFFQYFSRCFVQLNQFDDGLNYYEKALSHSENSYVRPIILLKAGDLSKELNQFNKAERFFQEIKDDYPKSNEANLIDIRLEQVK